MDGRPREAAGPPWRAGFCGFCGGVSAAGAACPRCRAAPVSLRWTEDASGRPRTLGEWSWAAVVFVWLAALLVGSSVMLGILVWRAWTLPVWSPSRGMALATLVTISGCAVWVAWEGLGDGLRPLLWRRWRFSGRDGDVRGTIASLAGRWFRGAGASIVRARSVAVPRDIPSAAEVERAGAGAVARAVARELRGGDTLTGVHVLVIAAALHLAERGAVRLSLVQWRSWRRTGAGARVTWLPPADGDLVVYAEPGQGEAPRDTLEAHLLAALRRPVGAVHEMTEETGRGGQGDPYREPAPLEAGGGRISLEVGLRWILDRLRRPAAVERDTAEAGALAGRLAAALAVDAELTGRLIGLADRVVERLQRPPLPRF